NTGAGDDTATFNMLEVGGISLLNLGNGGNTVTVDNSLFEGTWTLITGSGSDNVNIETAAGSTRPTTFERSVLILLGPGVDHAALCGVDDANQAIWAFDTFVIHNGGSTGESMSYVASKVTFPFGGFVAWTT